MKLPKSKLLSTTVIPALVGAGIAAGGAIVVFAPGYASGLAQQFSGALPAAKPKPGVIRLAAACNPCAAKKNPCNPCSPCGAGATASRCMIPRLQAAALGARNPCAAKNPCAAASACNPCAAKNPCNPCAAAKACNPCSPCGASAGAEVTAAEANKAYGCLIDEMISGYHRAGLEPVANYWFWALVASSPYQSATHGSRYVNNYANPVAAANYKKFEDGGRMPAGSVLAKDSFVVNPNGTTAAGPLFVMEKRNAGFNADSFDWAYTMVNPDGTVFGVTKGQGSANVEFCVECHAAVAEDQDSLFFLPEEFRVN